MLPMAGTNNDPVVRDIMPQRQQMILDFIHEFRESHDGVSPTDREIAIGIGYQVTSWGTVHVLIDDLVKQGWLRKANVGSRAYIPTRKKSETFYKVHTPKLLTIAKKIPQTAKEMID